MATRDIINPDSIALLNSIFDGSSTLTVSSLDAGSINSDVMTSTSINSNTLNTTLISAQTISSTTINSTTINASTSINSPLIQSSSLITSPSINASTSLTTPAISSNNISTSKLLFTGGVITSPLSPTLSAQPNQYNQLNVSGDLNIGASLIFNNNTPTNNNSITCPQYKGGIYGYHQTQTQGCYGENTITYTNTIQFNPFNGYNPNNVIIIPTILSDEGYFTTQSTQCINNNNGTSTINIVFFNPASPLTYYSAQGVNVLLFYQG
jgi:hypothetical protein